MDGLSCLSLGDFPENVSIPEDVVCVLSHMNDTTTTVVDIRKLTRQNPTLSSIRQCVNTTWPTLLSNNVELKPYYIRSSELSVQDDCIHWGSRVIVQPKLRKNMLHELHEAHPGIVRMKALAWSYVWRPLIDTDIESVVKECNMCQQRHKSPSASPLHLWEWPQEPWSRLHIDYAGPIRDKMLLIIVDAYSKWIYVHVTNSSTASATIQKNY